LLFFHIVLFNWQFSLPIFNYFNGNFFAKIGQFYFLNKPSLGGLFAQSRKQIAGHQRVQAFMDDVLDYFFTLSALSVEAVKIRWQGAFEIVTFFQNIFLQLGKTHKY